MIFLRKVGTTMSQIWASAIPAVIAAVVSLITFFSNKNSKVLEKLKKLDDRQIKMEEKFEYDRASEARTRIIRFNNELMQGIDHTKDCFDDIIENSIDVYEAYYNDPNHQKLKNGIAKSAVKNIYRVYDLKVQSNSFLQYPKEVNTHEGDFDRTGSAAC